MSVRTNVWNVGAREPYDKQLDVIITARRDYNPLLAMLNPGAMMTNQVREYWKEVRHLPTMYINTTQSSTSDTTFTLTTGTSASDSGEPIYELALGDVLLAGTEKLRITALTEGTAVTARSGTTNGYTTVTCSRGYYSSTAATHTAFAEAVTFLMNDAAPDVAFNGAVNDPGVERIEYAKFSTVEGHVDKSYRAVSSFPGGTGRVQDDYRRPIELAHKMEMALINSINTAGAESTAHKAGFTGIATLCTALTAGTHFTAAAITADELQGCINTAEDAGCDVDLIVMGKGGWLQKGINSWYKDEILKTGENGQNIGRIKSWMPTLTLAAKPITLMYHPALAVGTAYLLDSSKLQLKYVIKAEREVMGADGSGDRVQWYSQYMLVGKGRGTHRSISSLTGHA